MVKEGSSLLLFSVGASFPALSYSKGSQLYFPMPYALCSMPFHTPHLSIALIRPLVASGVL